ncbi:hypothetical protein JCGZ_19209 [Jatropha curcas]|uniref:Uncharacterized protein n=1 Tax=Jatropha curcas TaxID=180498 RepID=A0A067L7G5_JATCU|nr:hypothetical protein JCGZ_19209 [Jatropha curcas]
MGHVCPGLAFLALGLWHLFNHVKLHILQPNSYISSIWFPTSKPRYLELYLIILGSCISISMELFIMPSRHQPLDLDGTIPSNHLRHFEHSLISMLFLVYASFAILLDKIKAEAQNDLTQLLAAIALSQHYFLFHLHSTDHKGLESHYHWLLQLIILVSVVATLVSIRLPKNFLVSFVRSISIVFQGVWFIVMGIMLWTPQLIPKGCSIHNEDGQEIVRCGSQEALYRAKSLANILFSWFLIGNTIFSISFYLGMDRIYGKRIQYSSLPKEFEELQAESDVESQKEKKFFGETKTKGALVSSF